MAATALAAEPLTWQGCLAEAKKNHPDLISAVENVNQLKAAKAITVSEWFPQVTGTLDADRAKSNKVITNSYSYGVSATQLIFDGFKINNNAHGAAEDVRAAEQNYRFVSSGVRFDLRGAYVQLLKSQELVRVAEEIVAIRRGNLELITLRYESGLEHRGALLTAEANMAEAEYELSQAGRDVLLAQRQLSREMGHTQFIPMQAEGELAVRDVPLEPPDFDAMVSNNPSLLQAAAKKNAAAFAMRSAYGNFAPQVTGSAAADKTGSRWPPNSSHWNVGVGLTMPIFEGGLRVAQVNQADALYKQANADEKSIKSSLIVSLAQSWVDLRNTLENIAVQRKMLAASVERSTIAESQYSLGLISYDSWTIIEDSLVGAKKNYLNARANAMLAEARWVQAKGETLEYAD